MTRLMPNLALAVTMFDEAENMVFNVRHLGARFLRIEVVQSQEVPYPALAEALEEHPCSHYLLLSNLDQRTPEQRAANTERFDIGARSMARNYSAAFAVLLKAWEEKIDYAIGITGDTKLLHLYGVEQIIEEMGDNEIAVSRAIGQNFHKAAWTRKEMNDPNCPKGGRLQDESVKDFMPQFFIVRASLFPALAKIQVTNPWCFEQCLGDAIGRATQYVFSRTAYGFADGIIYHTPSPDGWKHEK